PQSKACLVGSTKTVTTGVPYSSSPLSPGVLTPALMNAKALLLLGSLLSGLTWTEHVLAFEDVWHAGGGLGAVNASASDVGLGIGANAYAAYGLNDMFDLKLDLAASSHAVEVVSGASERYRVLTATLGAAYKIDIIEWIPYFGVHAGYITSDLPEWIDME